MYNKIRIIIFLVLPAVFSCICSAQAENYIGETIDSLLKNIPVQMLSQDELISLITDQTLVGESAKAKMFGVYYKKHIYADGTFTLKVYRKGSEIPLKEITGNTWFVQPDGTWCTTRNDVRRCDKKVYKIGSTYLSVLKKSGKITGSWVVENADPAPKKG